MKKLLILLGVTLLCATAASAQLNLGSALSKLKDVATEAIDEVTNSEEGNSLTEGLSKLMDAIVPEVEIPGTWSYVGVAVEFTGDNALTNAGGALAASTVEEKLAPMLQKVGIKPGAFSFTFNEDGSLKTILGTKEVKGTWTYDKKAEVVTVTLARKEYTTRMTVNGKNINILFEADKLLELIKSIGTKSSNTTLNTINTIIQAYDGMNIGFECQKVK